MCLVIIHTQHMYTHTQHSFIFTQNFKRDSLWWCLSRLFATLLHILPITCHVSHVNVVRASSSLLLLLLLFILLSKCVYLCMCVCVGRILTLLLFYHGEICINTRKVHRIFKLSASGNILVFCNVITIILMLNLGGL